MILRETPWFSNHAFDEGAPFLYYENRDVAHWGENIFLGGIGFASGDEVEFRDATHSVRGPRGDRFFRPALCRRADRNGARIYPRVARRSARSNVVPVNFYP